jgi:phosphoenolpyruvate-protein phosphotransferase
MAKLTLMAPLEGWVAPLSEVPDAVFADRMLGDGVAIDPTRGELFAPCDGEIISVAKTHHALTLRAANGAEILLHIGLDTVALRGEGFALEVEEGSYVQQGQRLLCFDLDLLALRAKSVLTPIVVANAESFRLQAVNCNRAVQVGEALFDLIPTAQIEADQVAANQEEITQEATVRHLHGIHARPAALIVAALRNLRAEVRLHAHGRAANAKSAVSLMGLGIRANDAVMISASGPEASAAVAAVLPLVIGGDKAVAPRRSAIKTAPTSGLSKRAPGDPIRGVIASRGFAIGRAACLRAPEITIEEIGQGAAHEAAALQQARADVRSHLQQLGASSSQTARDVIGAHLEFVDDVELVEAAHHWIARGKSASYSWRRAIRGSAETLRALGDARMQERIADLLDIETQVLHALSGESLSLVPDLPEHTILIADELKPSQLVALDESRIAGICTARGGPTSHVAILAAAMGVPALAAAGAEVLEIPQGSWLVLDAELGHVRVLKDEQERLAFERAVAQRLEQERSQRVAAQEECRTRDGIHIEVFANLGSIADAQHAVFQGAEGCGLLRTEFLFLDRQTPPEEDEQLEQYQGIANVLGDRPLTIRTLDIGGDKPVPYLSLPQEPNPALGLRGVRTSLWRPDLLRVQLRAALRVTPTRFVRLLVPMVTDVAEIRAVRSVIEELRHELDLAESPATGAMIETPASALLAAELARCVDFFSIGTNDLTQYILAMDREHSELAGRIDGLHPAVLKMIAMVVEAATPRKRPVAVCGGLASDPAAVPILIGLGIRELSVVPSMIPQLKALIRMLSLEDCGDLAQRALQSSSAEEVRALSARLQVENARSSA